MANETIRKLDWRDNGANVGSVFMREIDGGADGPTLLVTAGEHGVELSGPAGIDILCRELAGMHFCGRLLAIPCISPCNIKHRAHIYGQTYGEGYGKLKEYNTYQTWPGKADGTPAERLCHLIWTEAVSQADAVINFHTWQRSSAGCLFTDISVPGAKEFAHNFGNIFNELHNDIGNGIHTEVLKTGRPAALVEMHGQYRIEPDSVERVKQGIYNIMVTMGMLNRPLDLPRPMFAIEQEHLIHAPKDGLFVPVKEFEQITRKGELLGYLLDVETGERTDIISPVDGAVWLISRNGPGADLVLQGFHAYASEGDMLVLIKEIEAMN